VTGAAVTPTIIELSGVEKTYRSAGARGGERRVGFRALNGVDLAVAAGEMVAITGPSGSGKTTIINLIAGIDGPTAGTVTVNGSRLDQMTEEQLACADRTDRTTAVALPVPARAAARFRRAGPRARQPGS